MRALIVVLVCLAAGACSGVLPYERSNAPGPTDRVVLDAALKAFAEAKLLGTPEISQVRAAHPVSPGDWLVCLRSSDARDRSRYALYFTGFTYVKSQLASLVDRCDDDMYLPFADGMAASMPGQPLKIR